MVTERGEEVREHAADLGGSRERDVVGLHGERRVVGEVREHAVDVHRVDSLEVGVGGLRERLVRDCGGRSGHGDLQ